MADKTEKTSRRTGLAVRRIGLLPAVVLTLVGLAVAGVVVWVLFTRLLRGEWPWQVGALDESTGGKDTTQIVLTVIAGLGAAVALVVAYRRQRDAELARFDERFAAAAAQLGAGTAAERLAGVYAMAALADTWEIHRQQCIEVLCGYLRLPYDPSAGLLKAVAVERALPADDDQQPGKETRTYEHLPNDRDVRLTIISTITNHLRNAAPISWQGHSLDFTGATFDGGDFSGATFTDGRVSFNGATFTGDRVSFARAQFAGGRVSFTRAQFTGDRVSFTEAQFTGGAVSFDSAPFIHGTVSFTKALFTGATVSFSGAQFCGSRVNFDQAKFTASRVSFALAEFTGGTITFNQAQFTGGEVTFGGALFTGSTVTPNRARLTAGVVTRDGAEFRGWPPPEPDQEPTELGAG